MKNCIARNVVRRSDESGDVESRISRKKLQKSDFAGHGWFSIKDVSIKLSSHHSRPIQLNCRPILRRVIDTLINDLISHVAPFPFFQTRAPWTCLPLIFFLSLEFHRHESTITRNLEIDVTPLIETGDFPWRRGPLITRPVNSNNLNIDRAPYVRWYAVWIRACAERSTLEGWPIKINAFICIDSAIGALDRSTLCVNARRDEDKYLYWRVKTRGNRNQTSISLRWLGTDPRARCFSPSPFVPTRLHPISRPFISLFHPGVVPLPLPWSDRLIQM